MKEDNRPAAEGEKMESPTYLGQEPCFYVFRHAQGMVSKGSETAQSTGR